jgi:hypothetical protein
LRAGRTSGAWTSVLATLLLSLGHLASPAGAAPQIGGEAESPDDLFREIDQYFATHPELMTTPGSGWKPYNRMKWFTQRRMDAGLLPPEGARWEAWEQKRQTEQALGPERRAAWFSLGPVNFGGRMLSMDFDPTDPTTVYAGAASGGLWRSTDSGGSWTPLTDDLPSLAIGGVGVSRTNPSVIVIGTGEPTFNIDQVAGVGILRSTDGGSTWLTTNISRNPSSNHGFHVVTAGPSGVFLAGGVDGLYRSADDGATWSTVAGTVGGSFVNGWYDVQWDPQDPSRVYAVKGNDTSSNGVHISTNDGQTWSLTGTGQLPSSSYGKSKLGVTGDNIYCYIGNQGFGGGVSGLQLSTDDGATWTTTAASNLPSGQSWYNLSCVADPNIPNRVLCGAVTLARSNDSGNSFATVGTGVVHVDHHALKYETGSNTRVWALSDGGAYFSASDGSLVSWQDRNNGLVTYQFYDICVNNGPTPYYVMGGTQDNGTDKWSGTTTWADGLGADGMVCNIDPTDGTTVYAEIQFGDHRKSTSSGVGFFSINNGITGSGQWVTPVAQNPVNGDILFTETSSGMFRTTNGGSNWSLVTGNGAVWIDVSPVDPDLVWAVDTPSGGVVRRSTNGGTTWTNVTNGFPFGNGTETRILAHPTDVNTVFVTFSSYSNVSQVAMSTNQGSSWTSVDGDLPNIPVLSMAVNPSNPTDWYVGTDLGVWLSTNGGTNWVPAGTGMPNVVVDDLEIQDGLQKLVAGTHGRGTWELAIGSSAVDAEALTPAPSRGLMLDTPWPNPVRDRALFRFAARSDATVSLRVYDITGRRVAQLEEFSRGDGIIRTAPWFTDDVPSGIYLVVLEAGAERLTRKVTVLK